MTRIHVIPAILVSASPAHAHSGHLGTLAGHDHWVLGLGLGALAGAAAVAWAKGRRAKADREAEEARDGAAEPEAEPSA